MSAHHTPEYLKAYAEANKERLIAYRKEYYKAHKDEMLLRAKLRRENNKEKDGGQRKKYYEANKAELREKHKEYRKKNKAKIAAQNKIDRERNRERYLERSRRHYHANKEVYRDHAKQYYENNRERHYETCKAWAAANPDKVKVMVRERNRKVRSTPGGHLNSTISKRMNESLRKGMKAGRHWESLVNFTVDQLKRHLEKLFKPGWTWENYGTVWHIDHKTPIAAFNFERPDDIDFRLCWSLKNLQPLEASKNLSKGARIEKPFQPSLAIGM
jgi:hypothetical protein